MWQTILVDMLFRGDKFRLPGKEYTLTCKEEPTIYPKAGYVKVISTSKSGQTQQNKFKPGSFVEVWFEQENPVK